MAARVHDSVLQTLTLIQRHSDEPKRVASLARRQERELRGWLYGDGAATGDTLVGALGEAAAEIEELHGIRVEVASGGDCPLDDDVRAVVLAAREAMQNAAKFSGAEEISVYAEAGDGAVAVFVRDRGAGFERAAVPADRHGLSRVDRRADGTRRRRRVDRLLARFRHGSRADAAEGERMKPRVVLVDDHALFRAGVRGSSATKVEIVGEAESVAEAVPLIKEARSGRRAARRAPAGRRRRGRDRRGRAGAAGRCASSRCRCRTRPRT